jgi:hypothetical protein
MPLLGMFMWAPMMMGRGMMGSRGGFFSVDSSASAKMPITFEQAEMLAMKYLNQNLPGASLEDPSRFYGYYTIRIIRDAKVYGMLSLNGYVGDVWFHSWHSYFIQKKGFLALNLVSHTSWLTLALL